MTWGITRTIGHNTEEPNTSSKIAGKQAADVNVAGPLSAFGDLLVSDLTPKVQIDAIHGIIDTDIEIFTSGTGATATVENVTTGAQFICKSGTDVGGYALIRTKRAVRYRPGQGVLLRYTALFETATANHLQRAGGINLGTELSFGYDASANFGIFYRTGGRPEIQYFDINTATGNQTLTFTLNGTDFAVSTTGANPTNTAYQVAAATDTFTGWDVFSNNSRITFIATTVGDKTGTFDVTTTGTFSGTFTEKSSGTDNVDTFYTQSSWNINTLLSNTSQSFAIDPTKGNVYQIQYQYLGYGALTFSVENPNDGRFIPVHQIQYANANTGPSLDQPLLKLGWFSANITNTTTKKIKGASAAGFVEGKLNALRNPVGHINSKQCNTSLICVLAIRNRGEINGRLNLNEVFPRIATISVDGTKPAEVEIHLNPTITGPQNWVYHDETSSFVEYDTVGNTMTGGQEIFAGGVSKTGDLVANLKELDTVLLRNQVLAIGVRATSGTTDATVGLTWTED